MKGTYVLLLELPRSTKVQVGSLGELDFQRGAYSYVGSALNGLEGRVKRHLREDKKFHWHIDYFLESAKVTDVIFAECKQRRECDIAKNLANKFSMIKDFGSSDCDCESHLFYSSDINELRNEVESSFEEEGLNPRFWQNGKEMAKQEKK